MARKRVWRNKTPEEKERRRLMNREKHKPEVGPPQKRRIKSRRSEVEGSEPKTNPEILDACYRRLSPMTREVVDNLVATGLSMEKVINGIRN